MGAAVGSAGPCIALLELSSIAAGHLTADALLKQAPVTLLAALPVSPGKYVILFSGEVESVSSALAVGVETAADALVDRLFIPNVEPTLLDHVQGRGRLPAELDAVGTIETLSVASAIVAGDVAAKTASITLVSVGLARGLGGKSWVSLCGEVSDVTAAVDAGAGTARAAGLLVRQVVIARPHADLRAALAGGASLS